MPALVGGFGNYLVPVQIGAPDCLMYSVRWLSVLHKPSNFGAYLAGLWEGDGHIWMSLKPNAPSGKRYTPHFAITFAEADYPLVVILKLLIGGTIRHKVDNHTYVLTITSLSGLLKVIGLINGHLRTPKITKFNAMIARINNDTGSSIATHSVDQSDLLSNAWLSGFIEADGSFDVRVSQTSTGSVKNRVSARVRLEQRQLDPITKDSYLDIMSAIAAAFGTTLGISTHNGDIKYFAISASSTKSRAIVVAYFAMFPLFSSKRFNFLDWLIIHNKIVDNTHTTQEGRDLALQIKSGMNSKRTYLNWDHLEFLKDY
jgi:hypothetical protein